MLYKGIVGLGQFFKRMQILEVTFESKSMTMNDIKGRNMIYAEFEMKVIL